jgi:hypothetical protein
MSEYVSELDAAHRGEFTELERAAVLWKALYGTMLKLRGNRNWIVVRHEGLSRDPITGFRELYSALGLQWSPSVVRVLEVATARDPRVIRAGSRRRNSVHASEGWKQKLSPNEVDKIRAIVSPVADAFYGRDAWM